MASGLFPICLPSTTIFKLFFTVPTSLRNSNFREESKKWRSVSARPTAQSFWRPDSGDTRTSTEIRLLKIRWPSLSNTKNNSCNIKLWVDYFIHHVRSYSTASCLKSSSDPRRSPAEPGWQSPGFQNWDADTSPFFTHPNSRLRNHTPACGKARTQMFLAKVPHGPPGPPDTFLSREPGDGIFLQETFDARQAPVHLFPWKQTLSTSTAHNLKQEKTR